MLIYTLASYLWFMIIQPFRTFMHLRKFHRFEINTSDYLKIKWLSILLSDKLMYSLKYNYVPSQIPIFLITFHLFDGVWIEDSGDNGSKEERFLWKIYGNIIPWFASSNITVTLLILLSFLCFFRDWPAVFQKLYESYIHRINRTYNHLKDSPVKSIDIVLKLSVMVVSVSNSIKFWL